jgi:hypothetical protein
LIKVKNGKRNQLPPTQLGPTHRNSGILGLWSFAQHHITSIRSHLCLYCLLRKQMKSYNFQNDNSCSRFFFVCVGQAVIIFLFSCSKLLFEYE